jgi:hypothetical protein
MVQANVMTGQLTDAKSALSFMLAGNATITLRSVKTEKRYTYKIREVNDQTISFEEPLRHRYFVGLLKGPDNEHDFLYLGMITTDSDGIPTFKLTRASRLAYTHKAVQALTWTLVWINRYSTLPVTLEVWHAGRCGRCNRKLTVPESVAAGIGPECAAYLGYFSVSA